MGAIAPMSEKGHLTALDSLRGIAALSVALGHIRSEWLPSLHTPYLLNTYLMVDFFFVLSGFVICYSTYDRIRRSPELAEFMWRRFWRLYPLHLTFLVMFVLLDAAKLLAPHHGATTYSLPFDGSLIRFSGMILANLLLIQDLPWLQNLGGGATASDVNVPAWSISCEFYVYLLFGFVVVWVGYRRRLAVLSLAISAGALTALFVIAPQGIDSSAGFFGIVRCLCGFFAGVLACLAYFFASRRIENRWIPVAAAICVVLFFVFVGLARGDRTDLVVYPIATLAIVLTALSGGHGPITLLNLAPLRWLGRISYSIYLSHFFIVHMITTAMRFLLHAPLVPSETGLSILLSPFAATVATIVCLTLILAVSDLTYRTIEEPFREWSRTYARAGFAGRAMERAS